MGGEQVEQEEIVEVDATGSGDEEETGVGVDGEESTKAGDDKEEEIGDVEETKGQDVEKAVDSEKGIEGRVGEEDEDVAEKEAEVNEEVTEKAGERDNDEREAEDVRGEIETEIVLVDDVGIDDQETQVDERSTRRQSRRNKKHDDEALASRAKRLRLEDVEETGDDTPQVQETVAAERDISPEALETRYETERKRKGKHAAKPQKKKSHKASTTVVINEGTPKAIRLPFAHPTEEEKEREEVHEETGIPNAEERT